jgi:predicted GTPase
MGNFRIVNAGKNRKKTHIKALIFGDSGAGKSYLSATAPNPLILLTEMNGQASKSRHHTHRVCQYAGCCTT